MRGARIPKGSGFGVSLMLFCTLLFVGAPVAAVLIFRPWPFSTDTAKYGRVALPNTAADILTTPLSESTRSNEATLDFDEGEVTVFYARARAEGRETLNRRYSPETFGLVVRPADGGPPLEIEDRGTTVSTNEGLTETVTIGEIEVPESGSYLVSAQSRTADDTGHITFGEEKLAATADRAEDVLITPWAAAYLALLAISGFFVARGFRGSALGAAFGKGPAAGMKIPQVRQTPEAEAQREAAMEQATKAQLEYLDKQLADGQITREQYEAAKAGILGQG